MIGPVRFIGSDNLYLIWIARLSTFPLNMVTSEKILPSEKRQRKHFNFFLTGIDFFLIHVKKHRHDLASSRFKRGKFINREIIGRKTDLFVLATVFGVVQKAYYYIL